MPIVELEWNPLSVASRAARAERAGRVGEALALYVQAGQPGRALECLHLNLPAGPLRDALLRAAESVFALVDSTAIARRAGVPETVLRQMHDSAKTTGDLLWGIGGRVAAASLQRVEARGVLEGYGRETAKITALGSAIQQAREGLAEATLADKGAGDVNVGSMRLRAVSDAARSLREEYDANPL